MTGSIFIIARKELKQFFVSTVGIAVSASFIILSEFFLFSFLNRFNRMLLQRQAVSFSKELSGLSLNGLVIEGYFQLLLSVMIFFVPLITMKLIAEERKQGTFELLMTSPVSVAEIILGKFLAMAIVVFMLTLVTGGMTFVLGFVGTIEILPILSGMLAVFLCSLSFVSIGLAASCLTSNQVVAAVAAIVGLLLLCLINAPADHSTGWLVEFLNFLTPVGHARGMIKGTLSLASVVYLLSLTLSGLAFSHTILVLRRKSGSAALQAI